MGKESKRRIRKTPDSPQDTIRLNKFIANAGVCSRREADQLISKGLITVNGKTVTELGTKVSRQDVVKYKSTILTGEKPVYILLNKPKDFITTTHDPGERKTVMDLVKKATDARVFPVGRLDRNTTGLLLFTNDGDLANKLTHPSHKISKLYKVVLDRSLTKTDFESIAQGIELEDGLVLVDEIALNTQDRKEVGIRIHIGRNRVIRRLFEHLAYTVVALDRVMYAGLTKKDLPRGKWRYLSKHEVIQLKHLHS